MAPVCKKILAISFILPCFCSITHEKTAKDSPPHCDLSITVPQGLLPKSSADITIYSSAELVT